MDHLIIMKKEWKLIPKIISGEKTSEARWFKHKISPWNKITIGDNLYFKDSGGEVIIRAKVTKVEQFEIDDNEHALKLMNERAESDLGTKDLSPEILGYINNKKYSIFVYFTNVKVIKPFQINKKGYGSQCAWITIKDINEIKIS
jgi:hypothetical protein